MASPDDPESRSQSQSPASLLWAHEIRRENIHLMDRIEGMGVTLASTAEMTLTLKQSVAELTNLVESLAAENRELRNELKDVEARLATRIESLDPRIGMLEDDNAELKASLVNAESRWKTLVAEHNRTVAQTRPEIMKEVKRLLVTEGKAPRSNGRVDEDLARAGRQQQSQHFQPPISADCSSCPVDTAQSTGGPDNANMQLTLSTHWDDPGVVVPDSVPLDESIPPSAQPPRAPLSELETTDGEDEQPSLGFLAQDCSREQDILPAKYPLPEFEQNRRSLAEYFSFAEKIWTQLPPRGRGKDVVVSFWRGLADERVRELLEKKLDEDGWTWYVLSEFCRRMTTEHENRSKEELKRAEADELKRKLDEVKRGTKDGKVTKPKRKRKRRCISLVPTDESDLIYMQ